MKPSWKECAASALLGLIVGVSVALYEYVINIALWGSFTSIVPVRYLPLLPLFGMIFTYVVVKGLGITSASMADEVVKAYHLGRSPYREAKDGLGKVLASCISMGFGASAGLEGAAKWLGASISQAVAARFAWFQLSGRKIMVVGAAAGISAIFRAPLSGLVMAIESPYKNGLSRVPLLPAALSSAVSFAAFSLVGNPEPYFKLRQSSFSLTHLPYAVFLAVSIGLLAQVFLSLLHNLRASPFFGPSLSFKRYLIGGILLALIAFICSLGVHEPLTLQSGLPYLRQLIQESLPLKWLMAILVLKTVATIITFGCGGVGGMFVPSAMAGAALGAIVDFYYPASPGLFALLGASAFIAATYKNLLFSVVFVAELTGNSMVTGLALCVSSIAYLISGSISNSIHQVTIEDTI